MNIMLLAILNHVYSVAWSTLKLPVLKYCLYAGNFCI